MTLSVPRRNLPPSSRIRLIGGWADDAATPSSQFDRGQTAMGIPISTICRSCASVAWVQWTRRSGSNASASSMSFWFFSRHERRRVSCGSCIPDDLFGILDIVDAADARTVAHQFPPSRPRMTGRQQSLRRPPAAPRLLRSSSRKSANPAVPAAIIVIMLERIARTRSSRGVAARILCFKPFGV